MPMTPGVPPLDPQDPRMRAIDRRELASHQYRSAEQLIATPLVVFAAGRKHFDAIVRVSISNSLDAKRALFAELPLEENGWNFETAKLSRVGSRDGWPIWRLERG